VVFIHGFATDGIITWQFQVAWSFKAILAFTSDSLNIFQILNIKLNFLLFNYRLLKYTQHPHQILLPPTNFSLSLSLSLSLSPSPSVMQPSTELGSSPGQTICFQILSRVTLSFEIGTYKLPRIPNFVFTCSHTHMLTHTHTHISYITS
jgi:hypothetical protein